MKTYSDLFVDLLPPMLQEFVRLIGLQATMKMVQAYGGLRIYVPKYPTPDHTYAELIGFDNLVKLSKVFGRQDHFQLPKATRALEAIRNAKIIADYGAKPPKTARQLAAEHSLTERQICRILATVPTLPAGNDEQFNLFG
jgi:Mor family transcriptional regulator